MNEKQPFSSLLLQEGNIPKPNKVFGGLSISQTWPRGVFGACACHCWPLSTPQSPTKQTGRCRSRHGAPGSRWAWAERVCWVFALLQDRGTGTDWEGGDAVLRANISGGPRFMLSVLTGCTGGSRRGSLWAPARGSPSLPENLLEALFSRARIFPSGHARHFCAFPKFIFLFPKSSVGKLRFVVLGVEVRMHFM